MGVTALPHTNSGDVDRGALRSRAERALGGAPVNMRAASTVETARLVHELQVQQVELEMKSDELRRLREELETARNKYYDLYDFAPVGYLTLESDGRIAEANIAAAAALGWERTALIGSHFPRLVDRQDTETYYHFAERMLKASGRECCELYLSRREGGGFSALVDGFSMEGGQWRLVIVDISDRKRAEDQLHRLAYYDPLTGLPNRELFLDRLGQAVVQAKRTRTMFGLMFLDLDRFKLLNDALGHGMGDRVLQEAGHRFRECVRETDTVSRMGGDEFTVLTPNMRHKEDTVALARKLLASLRRPFTLRGRRYYVSASVGIACFPADGQDAETLLKNADAVMYDAKERGRSTVGVFHEQIDQKAKERLNLETELWNACEIGDIHVYYQPQVDLETGEVSAVEALARWHHPVLGKVPPGRFISVAEETGIIVPMGYRILERACEQARAWLNSGIKDLRIAVNLSPHQFLQPDLTERIVDILVRSKLAARHLELEITESAAMPNLDYTVRTLGFLKDLGVMVTIDDFGTGFSSLEHLKRLPIQKLKIAETFVHDIPVNPDDAAIAEAIISMAHSLGLTVIAEGVERAEQLEFLRQHGCDEVQGYLYAKPLKAQAVTVFLQERSRGKVVRPRRFPVTELREPFERTRPNPATSRGVAP